MNDPVFSYSVVVIVALGQSDAIECRRALNRHHGFVSGVVLERDVTPAILSAHHKLHAIQQQTVTVDVFADGTRRIRTS